ncbi:MAG: LysM peptidoglycan-binding domain-containing protein [Bacteroidota bacterium]|nr:LysM peptidoglycan-binding domain-containing protein [Bacteroidota bacterium]
MAKRTLYLILLFGMMFMVTMPCSAQDNTKNERSKIIENLSGRSFYIHFVKEGQTLESISKLYEVPTSVLVENNPDLKTGLKADMILKIPVKDITETTVKPKPAPVQKKKDSTTAGTNSGITREIIYQIKRGETLYGIAKRYDVSMDEILKVNPGISSFRPGTKLHIPVIERGTAQPAVSEQANKPVAVNNPKPAEGKAQEPKVEPVATALNDLAVKKANGSFKVAMLIPFYLEEMDSILVDQPEPKSFAFLQFYEASLLAIDSLRKQGMDIRLYVYDSDDDVGVEKTKAILQRKELADMDLIVGPFYAKCFEIASKFAGAHKIPIVNPLSKRSEIIAAKPWVFKVQPSATSQMREAAEFVNKHFASANLVLVRSDKVKLAAEATAFKTELQPLLRKENMPSNIRESFFNIDKISGLKLRLSTTKPNILVVLSNDEVFVTSLMQNLDQISSNYDLTVMGMPSWEQFKLDINLMMHVKLHLFSNKYVDFSNEPVQKFSSRFMQDYSTLPQVKDYGFDGYDITYYFLSSLMKYGRQFGNQVEEYNYQGLQNSFHFHKLEGGGYENSGVNFYKFENNNLKRVE